MRVGKGYLCGKKKYAKKMYTQKKYTQKKNVLNAGTF